MLRPGPNFTNGGVSSCHDELLVISQGDTAPADPSHPVMVLGLFGPEKACLRPLHKRPGDLGPFAGGNWAQGGADFHAAVSGLLGRPFEGPVAIHDRYESQELYDTLGPLELRR